MVSPKKQRELWVGHCVATAINSSQGTDYQAVKGADPPDVDLVSATNAFPQIFVEVVSLPSLDMTARVDNQNICKFRDELAGQLVGLPYDITVHLQEKSKRHGIPKGAVDSLAGIIQQTLAEANSTKTVPTINIEFTKRYSEFPDIADYVLDVHCRRISGRDSILIIVPLATWAPDDDSWIRDAIEKKHTYSPQATTDWIFAIDGSWVVDQQQIDGFKSNLVQHGLSFREIWIVTDFHGTVRLK
jgi:hypothetical protein